MFGTTSLEAFALSRRALTVAGIAAAVMVSLGLPFHLRQVRVAIMMQTGAPGEGQVFIARGEEGFSEERSRVFNAWSGGEMRLYTVAVPADAAAGLRFRVDPVNVAEATLSVAGVQVEEACGWRVRVWRVPLERVEAAHHLAAALQGARLQGRTTGGDPQLAFSTEGLSPHACLRGTIPLAAALLAAWLVALRLWRGAIPEPAALRHMVCLLALAAFVLQGWYYAQRLALNGPPDERSHVSYVTHLAERGLWRPDRPQRFEFDYDGAPKARLIHLAHPPLYYDLLKPFVPRDPREAMLRWNTLRGINLVMAACGVGLFLGIVARRDLPLPFHLFFAVALLAVPMLPYLAGAVTNDNLLLIAGGLSVTGALAFLKPVPDRNGLIALAGGLALGLLTKATAGMHLMLFTGLVFAVRLSRDRSIRAFLCPQAVALAALAALPLAAYVTMFVMYGTFTPFTGVPDGISAPAGVSTPATPRDFAFFTDHFFTWLDRSWTGVFSHDSVLKRSAWEALPLNAVLVLALAGLVWPERDDAVPETTRRFFGVMRLATVATLLMVPIHFHRAWDSYTHDYLGGMQARYYFTLMPCLLALAWRPFLDTWRRPVGFVALTGLMTGLMASGCYFFVLMK